MPDADREPADAGGAADVGHSRNLSDPDSSVPDPALLARLAASEAQRLQLQQQLAAASERADQATAELIRLSTRHAADLEQLQLDRAAAQGRVRDLEAQLVLAGEATRHTETALAAAAEEHRMLDQQLAALQRTRSWRYTQGLRRARLWQLKRR